MERAIIYYAKTGLEATDHFVPKLLEKYLYEDYREQLITAEELCQYQREYESRVNEIEAQITELLHRRSLYEKEFHIDEGWEETVNKYMAKRKLTKELVDAFVSEIVFYDGNIEVYDNEHIEIRWNFDDFQAG